MVPSTEIHPHAQQRPVITRLPSHISHGLVVKDKICMDRPDQR